MKSTSGLNNILNSDKKETLIFSDNTCPKCGYKMSIIEDKVMGKNIKLRFKCFKCSFECPIYHNENNPSIIRPLYDSDSTHDFFNSFGKDSKEYRDKRINEALN